MRTTRAWTVGGLLAAVLASGPAMAASPADLFLDRYVAATQDGGARAMFGIYAAPAGPVLWPGRPALASPGALEAAVRDAVATGCRTEPELAVVRDPYSVNVFASLVCPPVPGAPDAQARFSVAAWFVLDDQGLAASSTVRIAAAALPAIPGTTGAMLREAWAHGPTTDEVNRLLGIPAGGHAVPNQLAGDPWSTEHFVVLTGVLDGFDPALPRRKPGTWDLGLLVPSATGAPPDRRVYLATDPLAWQPLCGRPR